MMLSTALKDLAVELNIFMSSSTQLSGDFESKIGPRTQTFLRDSKAIADKVDSGMIMVRVGKEEGDMIFPIADKLGKKRPNMVTDIYKVRRGRYKNVKIWSYVDLGTCRWEDIFITDCWYNPIDGFEIYRNERLVQDTIEENEDERRSLRDMF